MVSDYYKTANDAGIDHGDETIAARWPGSPNKGVAEKAAPTPTFEFAVSLSGDMAKYGPDIRRFIDAMIYKLEKNVAKGKWEDLPIERAFKLLEGEVYELQAEVHGDRNMVRTMLEAADVANFALIVAAIAMERGR